MFLTTPWSLPLRQQPIVSSSGHFKQVDGLFVSAQMIFLILSNPALPGDKGILIPLLKIVLYTNCTQIRDVI